jgi:hypothetical protein
MSQWISDGGEETKLRLLNCQDQIFESVEIFSIVETRSRQIETPRLTLLSLPLGCSPLSEVRHHRVVRRHRRHEGLPHRRQQ